MKLSTRLFSFLVFALLMASPLAADTTDDAAFLASSDGACETIASSTADDTLTFLAPEPCGGGADCEPNCNNDGICGTGEDVLSCPADCSSSCTANAACSTSADCGGGTCRRNRCRC